MYQLGCFWPQVPENPTQRGLNTKVIYFYYLKKFYLLIFGYAGSSLLRKLFSSCGEWGLLSSCGVWASHCGGFSCAAQALRCPGLSCCCYNVGQVVAAPGP